MCSTHAIEINKNPNYRHIEFRNSSDDGNFQLIRSNKILSESKTNLKIDSVTSECLEIYAGCNFNQNRLQRSLKNQMTKFVLDSISPRVIQTLKISLSNYQSAFQAKSLPIAQKASSPAPAKIHSSPVKQTKEGLKRSVSHNAMHQVTQAANKIVPQIHHPIDLANYNPKNVIYLMFILKNLFFKCYKVKKTRNPLFP